MHSRRAIQRINLDLIQQQLHLLQELVEIKQAQLSDAVDTPNQDKIISQSNRDFLHWNNK
jgi:hypothetical protein